MREFLVGLIFILAVFILGGIGFLLLPLFMLLGFILQVIFGVVLVFFAIWLLGKLIIILWEFLKK